MLTLSLLNTVFVKLSEVWLKRGKKALAPLIVWEVRKYIGWGLQGQIHARDEVPGTDLLLLL